VHGPSRPHALQQLHTSTVKTRTHADPGRQPRVPPQLAQLHRHTMLQSRALAPASNMAAPSARTPLTLTQDDSSGRHPSWCGSRYTMPQRETVAGEATARSPTYGCWGWEVGFVGSLIHGCWDGRSGLSDCRPRMSRRAWLPRLRLYPGGLVA